MTPAQQKLAEAIDAFVAASTAHEEAESARASARMALIDARLRVKAARIEADKELPGAVIHVKTRYASLDRSINCAIIKRTPKSVTLREIGETGARSWTFRISKHGKWVRYPKQEWPTETWLLVIGGEA